MIADGDAGQTGAINEGILPDTGDTAADDDSGQTGATFKCTSTNTGNAIRNGDAS